MVNRRIIVGSFGLFGWAGLVYADSTVDFFTDPALFDAALQAAGKVSKGKWDFAATNSQGPSATIGFSDPLDINNPGPFDKVPLDNITIQSNLNPQGQGGTNPRGPPEPSGARGNESSRPQRLGASECPGLRS